MALHQDCKGSLIVPLSEALEQLPIRQVGTVMCRCEFSDMP